MTTKLPHYTLPAFPFLALLFARRWDACGLEARLPINLGWLVGAELALLAAVFIPLGLKHHASPSPVGELVREAGGVLTPQMPFALVDFNEPGAYAEPNAIWEMRRVTKSYGAVIPREVVLDYLHQPGPCAVVLSSSLWRQIDWTDFNNPFRTGSPWSVYTASGFNAAKGRFIDVTLVVKP
jgi:hypothetical protein